MGTSSRVLNGSVEPAPDSSVLRRLWRVAYWLPRDLSLLWRARFPSYVVYFGGTGFGDDLLLATVLEELRRRGHRRLAVVSRLEEIFRHSPPEIRYFNEEWRLLEAVRYCGARVAHPKYFLRQQPPVYDVPAQSHIITEMCRSAGLTGRVDLRTYYYPQPDEIARGKLVANQAVIQCTAPESLTSSIFKHWYTERYQEVVHSLKGRLNFVQLGSRKEPPLEGVLDLRGKTSIRESAAILANSRVHVGYVGFLMHLARAVECRGVIVFGGRERPDQSGYVCNENLFTPLPCSPCWRISTCDFDRLCMQRITSDDVVAAAERVLARAGEPLEIAQEEIPAAPREFELPWMQLAP